MSERLTPEPSPSRKFVLDRLNQQDRLKRLRAATNPEPVDSKVFRTIRDQVDSEWILIITSAALGGEITYEAAETVIKKFDQNRQAVKEEKQTP